MAAIVFDRLLIEELPHEKVTFGVKGSPVINDATMEDAEMTGLTRLVEVVENGSDAPGTILEGCSGGFRERFERSDLIIAKGQGNYESLSGVDKDMFSALPPSFANAPFDHRDLHGVVHDEARDHRVAENRERLPPRQWHESRETHECQDGARDRIRREG
jgi:predicted nucleic acid-binding Zn ribbon protein